MNPGRLWFIIGGDMESWREILKEHIKMKTLYFDCFSGISGDMTLGALIDAGLDFEQLKSELSKLDLHGYTLSAEKEMREYLTGTKFTVKIDGAHEHPHRALSDIRKIISDSGISDRAKKDSIAIFEQLAQVEAAIHNSTPEKIHFHEVGAVDSIIDIVGAAIGIEMMGIENCVASAIPLGSGVVKAAHGDLPVPAPATVKLLEGAKVYSSSQKRELVTPTGAAILSYYCHDFGTIPLMKIEGVGYGAGQKDVEEMPNMLRIIMGLLEEEMPRERMEVIEANIDDMNPEFYDYIIERLFAAGALDVYLVPIHMKKNRPANILTVLAHSGDCGKLISIILEETTTFGLRTYTTGKVLLNRQKIEVETPYGKIKVKMGYSGEKATTISPEYDDCKKAAQAKQAPIKTVYAEAYKAALKSGNAPLPRNSRRKGDHVAGN